MIPINGRRLALAMETEQVTDPESLFMLAAAGADIGVWECNTATGYFYAHPVLLDMLGLDDRQMPLNLDDWLENVDPEDRLQARQNTQRLACGQASRVRELRRMVHNDGTVRHFLSRAVTITHADGLNRSLIGAEIDVTELMRPSRPDPVGAPDNDSAGH